MREPVNRLQKQLGYEFNQLGLLETALTHRSVSSHNNERSEFLGDSILGFVIADLLFHQFPGADEGQLSRLRASLVKKETLASIARELAIGKYLKLGQGELRSGGHARDSILADAVEAIIAAIYLDSGYEAARHFISSLYKIRMEGISLDKGEKDPKTRLQEYLQSKKLPLPEYQLLEATGPQHAQKFRVKCHINGNGRIAIGEGDSKRKAEQDAAEKILESYE